MNLKLRFQNKATLLPLLLSLIALIYLILGMFGITPRLSEDMVTQVVSAIIDLLFMMGILIDPTTQGIGDSERAMQYDMPNKPELPEDYFEDGEDDADC